MKKIIMLAGLLLAYAANAAVVYTQPPAGGGMLPSAWWTPNGSDYDQYAWDSFSLASSAPVTEVKWRGGFGYGNTTNSIAGFTVTFYSSIGGNSQPNIATAPPLATYTVSGNPGQTSAGTVGSYPMYDYDFVLPTPFQAVAGTVYWIQIEASQTGIPDWCLAGGSGGNGSYFRRFAYVGDLYFSMGSGDAAFTLLTSDAAIYSVAASASPVASGTIAGAGLFPTGVTASLVATPATNFAFVNWTQNGALVSSSANYSFAVISNRALVANFTNSVANLAVVYTQPQPPSSGAIPSSYLYPDGMDGDGYAFDNFTLATTQDISQIRWIGGYRYGYSASNPVFDFNIKIYSNLTGGTQPDIGSYYTPNPLKSYTVGGNALETPAGGYFSYQFTLPSSFHAVAGTTYWVQIEAQQTGYPNDWGMGYGAGGDGVFFYQVTASSASIAASDLAFTLLAPAGTNSSTITTLAQPAGGGTTSGAGTFANFLTTSVSAVPASGYAFAGWSANGATVSTNATYQFTVSTNVALSAIFNPTFSVSLTASPAAGGTVAGAGTYFALASVNAVAHTNAGYSFVNWTEAGVPICTATNYNFTVAAARTLVANYALIPVPVAMTNSSRTNLSFAWNPAVTGWVLQESSDLITWTNSTRPLTTNGSQRSLTITTLGGNKFFRLSHP